MTKVMIVKGERKVEVTGQTIKQPIKQSEGISHQKAWWIG
jgi:hypothetical protein